MKALSVTQPWASLIVLGAKRQETRTWDTEYRGLLAIHAARQVPEAARDLVATQPFKRALGGHAWDRLPLGALIGYVTLTQCYKQRSDIPLPGEPELSFGDYRLLRWVWVLTDPHILASPIPMRGERGVWACPYDLSDENRFPTLDVSEVAG